jgi:hypothetical protein
MVRRGRRFESVRGLQVSSCSASGSVVSAGVARRLRRPRNVHQRPPWPLPRASLRRAGGSRARVHGRGGRKPVDHGQAGAHVAGEVEGGDAGMEREGGEGVAEIVDPSRGLGRIPPRSEIVCPANRCSTRRLGPLGQPRERPQPRSPTADNHASSAADRTGSGRTRSIPAIRGRCSGRSPRRRSRRARAAPAPARS